MLYIYIRVYLFGQIKSEDVLKILYTIIHSCQYIVAPHIPFYKAMSNCKMANTPKQREVVA